MAGAALPSHRLSPRRCISDDPPPPPLFASRPHRPAPLTACRPDRLVTFNTIKTKKGWVWAGGFAALCGIMQTYYIGSAIVQKRRRIKALEDVKKM